MRLPEVRDDIRREHFISSSVQSIMKTIGLILLATLASSGDSLFSQNSIYRTNSALASTADTLIKPGIYRTAPFSGIVVVPGTNLDNGTIILTPKVVSRMPIVR